MEKIKKYIYIAIAIILCIGGIHYYNTHIDIAGTWVRAKSNAISNNNGGVKKLVFDDYGNGKSYGSNGWQTFHYSKDGNDVTIGTETEYINNGLLKLVKEQGIHVRGELHRSLDGTYLTIKDNFEFSGKYVRK